jgi:hypothetical protein
MPQRRYNLIWLGLFLSACLGPAKLPACNVPVFRYALERWNPDSYVAVVFHQSSFLPDQAAGLEYVTKTSLAGSANLLARSMDVSGQVPDSFHALWEAQQKPVLPWLVVRYPAQTGIEPSVWAGPLSSEIATHLIDSPVRRELGRRLLSGDTAVWLLLESGDKPCDDALEKMLTTESKTLVQALELPQLGPDDPEISPDLPLKVAFSTLRVSRLDAAENLLVRQLVSWNPSLGKEPLAMLFPVFGRGRVLPPAMGNGITPQVIGTMARLLTGPCSCQIKEMNAGFDLLMAVDWSKAFSGKKVRAVEPPPLAGLSQFSLVATNVPTTIPEREFAMTMPPQPVDGRDHLMRNLVILTVLAAVFLALTTIFLRAKGERRSGTS